MREIKKVEKKKGVENEGWRDAKKGNDSVGLKTPLKRGRCTGILVS